MSEIIINAAEAMSLLKKHHFKGLKELLTTAPEVVRCRDCEYCHNTLDAKNNAYLFCEQWDDLPTEEDGFCSKGVRRDNGKVD